MGNVLGAIKTARFYGFGANDPIVAIWPDNMVRYPSVMEEMARRYGQVDEAKAIAYAHIFRDQKMDWVHNGTTQMRKQGHNLKYYPWVEQQDKTVGELNAQLDPAWWVKHQEMVAEIDTKLKAARG